jgi:iron(III) transport system substrate-binding protein
MNNSCRRRFKVKAFLALFVGSLLGAGTLHSQTLDELHKTALKEGGTLNFYATLAQINAEKILPVFEKRFPGVKVNHVDATSDKLVARAVTEARGGKTLADVLQVPLENVVQVHDQGLLLESKLPESTDYPDSLKGSFWISSDMQFFVAAWNTNLVKKEEEPKSFDDFAHPRWKNRLIAEPRDLEMLLAFAKYKFKSDEKAIELLKKIAANNVEFHKGHSQLAELLDLLFASLSHSYQKGSAAELHALGGGRFDQRYGGF